MVLKSDESIQKDPITENMLLLDTVQQEMWTHSTIYTLRQVPVLQRIPVNHMHTLTSEITVEQAKRPS